MKKNNLSNISITTQDKYNIIRYNKKLPENMHYRSVIQDTSSGNIVCIAPSKSVEFQDDMYNNIMAEEFIDGTMINLFWDNTDWQLATRSCIGGDNRFYNDSPTFRYMFLEAFSDEFNFNDLPIYSENNLPLVYSFVLQHVDNRIVVPIQDNRVYLVELFEINNMDEYASINIINLRENEFAKHIIQEHHFMRPKLYNLNCNKTDIRLLKERYAGDKTPYMIQGIVFKNMDLGLRAKYRNPNYEKVRKLRGNQSKKLYRYLELNKDAKILEYLKYYSEEWDLFVSFHNIWKKYINQLYAHYVDCYILHKSSVKSYPYKYKVHMYKLHEKYKETREKTTLDKVEQYMRSLHTAQQMYVLNSSHT